MKKTIGLLVLSGLLFSCSSTLPVQYYQKTLQENNHVENSKNNYTLYLDPTIAVSEIFVTTPTGSTAVKSKNGIVPLKKQLQRPYFELVSGNDTLIVANRHIDFSEVVNFRDIGGLPTQDGRTVQWGKIFRSDNLSKLKNREFDKFRMLQITTVYDLRTSSEIKGKEDHLPETIDYVHYPSVEDDGDMLTQMRSKVINGEISEVQSVALMEQLYQSIVADNILSLRSLIHHIVNSDTPVVYHCSAGKDRTGIVTAILLSILNVDRNTIQQEYLLSNYYRTAKLEKILGTAKLAKVIKPHLNTNTIENFMKVDERYLNAAFKRIDQEYGGMDSFIKNQLGIDETLRRTIIQKFTYR